MITFKDLKLLEEFGEVLQLLEGTTSEYKNLVELFMSLFDIQRINKKDEGAFEFRTGTGFTMSLLLDEDYCGFGVKDEETGDFYFSRSFATTKTKERLLSPSENSSEDKRG